MPNENEELAFAKPIRDTLNELGIDGDLYMRLKGFYWMGPKGEGITEPEFGYRDMTRFATPINHDAAEELCRVALNLSFALKDAKRYAVMVDWYMREGKRSEINPDGHISFTHKGHIDEWADHRIASGEKFLTNNHPNAKE